jgi:hypothetical protein
MKIFFIIPAYAGAIGHDLNGYHVGTAARVLHVTKDHLKAMREWVSDCAWREDCETDEFTDEEIIRGVEKHFDGGLDAFFKTLEVVA